MDNQKWWRTQSSNVNQNDQKNSLFLKKFRKTVLLVVIALLAVTAVLSSVYTVNDKQQAVVTTFGRVTSVEDPGIHFKLPFGIQKAELV